VAKIDSSQTYDKGRPKLGGLSDPRMGTMDRSLKCTTDGSSVLDCPGYFGHIELAKPMYHVHFIRTVLKVLRCVSYHNSKLLLLPVRAPRVIGWQRLGSFWVSPAPCALM
jgi:DNA-directed RNA polymerase II subunit RPB1